MDGRGERGQIGCCVSDTIFFHLEVQPVTRLKYEVIVVGD